MESLHTFHLFRYSQCASILAVVENSSSFTGNAIDVRGIFTITATVNAKGSIH